MKTISALAAASILAFAAGCTAETSETTDGNAPAVDLGGTHTEGYALPGCTDPSGFCLTSVPAPTYLPPRGGFDADARGLFYISYRPDFVSGTITYPDYYTAVQVDWDGKVVTQSKPLPGRPSVKNPIVFGKYFVFGEGTRNAVMDVTGSSNAFLTNAEPYAGYPDMTPNGGVMLGDGRYLSTTDFGGGALGVSGGKFSVPIECGPTDAYRCQVPATDRTPSSHGYAVAHSNSITRVRVPDGGGIQISFGHCATPASWSISPTAPLATAPDGAAGLHAAFRLTSGTLVDCRMTNDFYRPTLRTIALAGLARDYDFDTAGGLWIIVVDQNEIDYRSPSGVLTRIGLPAEPAHLKVMADGSAIVSIADGRFYRIRHR